MGSPRFNGSRLDAEENHKIKDVVIRDLFCVAVGGVKKEKIPVDSPCVLDMKQPDERPIYLIEGCGDGKWEIKND